MKLREFEGKKLFRQYGIPIPRGIVLSGPRSDISLSFPFVLKAQIRSGNRKAVGGVVFVKNSLSLNAAIRRVMKKKLEGEKVLKILVEEKIAFREEYYVSFSYDTETRAPVLSLSRKGGSGIASAFSFPVDLTIGIQSFFIRESLKKVGFLREDLNGLSRIIEKLWSLFLEKSALLVEVNPLFKTQEGNFVAGDAKIILDDEASHPGERRYIDMKGDIAILASGGGASLLNIDTLVLSGGKPANYTEYSGNPPASIVKRITKRVLGKKDLKGCWVIGGTANFTDIYETMKGFIEGLAATHPKPRYPFVIRRDGPRQKEGFEMLSRIAKKKGYDFHLFDSRTSMSETARIITKLAYKLPRKT